MASSRGALQWTLAWRLRSLPLLSSSPPPLVARVYVGPSRPSTATIDHSPSFHVTMLSPEASVPLASLERWYTGGASAPVNDDPLGSNVPEKRSPFPFDPVIAAKIVLWQGNLVRLEADAIVNSTNESLSDRSGLCGDIFRCAGPELAVEVAKLEGCRTGESKATKGYSLPARYVVAAVAVAQSRTCSQNKHIRTYPHVRISVCVQLRDSHCWSALQRQVQDGGRECAPQLLPQLPAGGGRERAPLGRLLRRQLDQARLPTRGWCSYCIAYVRQDSHSRTPALRTHSHRSSATGTVRRFLDRFGQGIETVVFTVENESDYDIYSRVLRLYFPRSYQEEEEATRLLPEDLGTCLYSLSYLSRSYLSLSLSLSLSHLPTRLLVQQATKWVRPSSRSARSASELSHRLPRRRKSNDHHVRRSPPCSLLVARCSLLVARCSLLVARCVNYRSGKRSDDRGVRHSRFRHGHGG